MELHELPGIDGVSLWLIEGVGTPLQRSELWMLLSEDERARALRFKVERARESFVVSRGSLRKLVGHVLGCPPETLQFSLGEFGKPFLSGHHKGHSLTFNVSHSGDLFLYGITQSRHLGIDVEEKRPDVEIEDLAERFFSPNEARRLIAEGSRSVRLDSFYRCWTRKEAYLKAMGTGLSTQLDAFEVAFSASVSPALLQTSVPGEVVENWRMFEVPVPEGYEAALVVGI